MKELFGKAKVKENSFPRMIGDTKITKKSLITKNFKGTLPVCFSSYKNNTLKF